jgi:hypothetical protein
MRRSTLTDWSTIPYYDTAKQLVGKHSTNYEDNAVPIIYDAFGSLNQAEEFRH